MADESYRAERVREILTAALTQPPGERATFVRAAANDAQIAAEVLALLRHMRLAMRDATNSTPAAESTDVGQRSQSVAMSEKGRETADASTLLKRGFLLSGRYRIKREIGRGGMGAVYEAVDERLHNIVAVKQMLATANRRAFEREARLLAALRHSGLPVVIDYFTEGDAHYLVMQYIDGEDLHHRFERLDGSLQEHDVVSWAIATLDVLVYLHSRTPPIVHRDIKPANIKVTPSGAIVLLDFGLAKGRLDRDSREYSIFGYTPGYAPPEQVEGQGTDARSDLYALGATLFHLVTGVPPVGATSRLAAVAAGHPDPQPAAAQLNTNVSPMLSEVLRRATALDARLRFPSAADMREELSRSRAAPAPSAPEPASARRVDAAIPSHGKIGEQLDLIVQVRFADSPLLGLEDWPTRRAPERIEQTSESIRIEWPKDPRTGTRLPARLWIRLNAPDFDVAGESARLIEVPPDDYSKRIVFLMIPRHPGFCRVNVEVYAVDELYLGTIPVEAEAVSGGVLNPVIRVANLILGLFAERQAPSAVLNDLAGFPSDTMPRVPAVGPAAPAGSSPPAAHIAPGSAAKHRSAPRPADADPVAGDAATISPRSQRRRWWFVTLGVALLAVAVYRQTPFTGDPVLPSLPPAVGSDPARRPLDGQAAPPAAVLPPDRIEEVQRRLEPPQAVSVPPGAALWLTVQRTPTAITVGLTFAGLADGSPAGVLVDTRGIRLEDARGAIYPATQDRDVFAVQPDMVVARRFVFPMADAAAVDFRLIVEPPQAAAQAAPERVPVSFPPLEFRLPAPEP